jgi:nucleoside-diphosphate-sugar epimerase
VLVTGAAGFIGRPAVGELHRRGFAVHGLGRHAGQDDLDAWHEVDLLDLATVDALVRRIAPTHLLHLAWCTQHGRFWDDPANDRWVAATVHLAEAVRATGGERIVVAGSCAQYDWTEGALAPDGVARERLTPRRPATRYGRAKEAVTETLADAAVGLVFFPYGPHEQPERLVPSVTRALLAGTPAEISTGSQVRDFLHVDDCGAAFAALVDSHVTGPVNVGSGTGTAVVDVARTIAHVVGRDDLLRVGALPDRPDEPRRLVADASRLHDEVGFTPRFDLESGVRDVVEWWRQEMRRK